MVWAFGALVVVTYFGLLGHFPLDEPDEPRYAEIAREMLVLHDWVTPHLNFVKYFEKPPLVYWMTALAFRAFGMSEFVVRLSVALFSMLGIAMAFVTGRAMYGAWVGVAAAAVLATSPLYFGLSQIVILDMPLSILMSGALAAFWFAYTSDGTRRRMWTQLVYVVTALAVLTKGPVAVLLIGAIVLAFLVLRRDRAALRWLVSPLGIVLFLGIGLPWFVLVSRRNPEFVDFFIIKQHIQRFLTPDEHQQPLGFFVPIVFGGMLPWTLFVLCAPRLAARLAARLVTLRVSAATLYCLLWSGIIFVFFSLSGSKLATYVLPIFVPLAILLARFLQRVVKGEQAAVLRRGYAGGLVAGVVCVIGAAVTSELVDAGQVAVVVPRAYAGGLILIGAALGGLLLARRQALQRSLALLAFAMLAVQLVAISGRSVAAQFRPLGLVIRAQARPQDLVISYRHYVQGITFYGRHRVIMVGGRGELDFGSKQGDQRAFFWNTDAELLHAWSGERHVFLVINRSELEPLRDQLHPAPRQIAAHGKKVIIVNFE